MKKIEETFKQRIDSLLQSAFQKEESFDSKITRLIVSIESLEETHWMKFFKELQLGVNFNEVINYKYQEDPIWIYFYKKSSKEFFKKNIENLVSINIDSLNYFLNNDIFLINNDFEKRWYSEIKAIIFEELGNFTPSNLEFLLSKKIIEENDLKKINAFFEKNSKYKQTQNEIDLFIFLSEKFINNAENINDLKNVLLKKDNRFILNILEKSTKDVFQFYVSEIYNNDIINSLYKGKASKDDLNIVNKKILDNPNLNNLYPLLPDKCCSDLLIYGFTKNIFTINDLINGISSEDLKNACFKNVLENSIDKANNSKKLKI